MTKTASVAATLTAAACLASGEGPGEPSRDSQITLAPDSVVVGV